MLVGIFMKNIFILLMLACATSVHSTSNFLTRLSDEELNKLVENLDSYEKKLHEIQKELKSIYSLLQDALREKQNRFFESPSTDMLSNELYDLYMEVIDTKSESARFARMQYQQKKLKALYEKGEAGFYKITTHDKESIKEVLRSIKKTHPEWENRKLEISIGGRSADENTDKAIGKYNPQNPNQHCVTLYLY